MQGRVPVFRDRMETAARWRELAGAKSLSIRELMIEVTNPASFVGTALQVANQIEKAVALRAADGFILVPHVTPAGLDEFADTVVPILQNGIDSALTTTVPRCETISVCHQRVRLRGHGPPWVHAADDLNALYPSEFWTWCR